MPLYNVSVSTSANLTVTVEADSPEEARTIAEEAASPNLCVQCSGYATQRYNPASEDPPWDLDLGDFDFSDARIEETTR